ncbi:MAG TPA: phosphoenolpyruvate--protein phosphotransferase [Burkholderiaceae bacterium]|nr:phosphoenolpyruvate--protein phosphotransferase [Burkholderiaceae bacterium]HPE01732.1 phosphoenolpyruvate--protein phosphotransferase [Burkholderiaceae bacterium]HRZ00950.1 phosphoenolpyruvate--protein phosphotransferase [Burkholderiaceae bacterium]
MKGISVSRGIALGRAHLLAPSELDVRQFRVERGQVLHEIARLRVAFDEVRDELDALASTVGPEAPGEVAAFLNLHRLILDDELLSVAPRDLIRERLINAEWALTIQLEEVCRQFEAIEDEYFRERATDVRQVVERVLRRLAGARPAVHSVPRTASAGERLVLVARELAPADVLHLKERPDFQLAGLVTEIGGPTSHTAILARSLGLPALIGVEHAREHITEDEEVVVDADRGCLVLRPTAEELTELRRRLRDQAEARARLRKLKGRIARTTDGLAIDLMANIELPEDARDALEAGADGIGLFRSEFLFMNRDQLPSEDEQFEAYAKVARAMKGKPVVIRTLDIGADKVLTREARASLGINAGEPSAESNPALGLRAIRYCLAYPELFLTQLRAILRASAVGTVRILVPMLAHTHEIEQTLQFISRARADLKERKLKYDARVPVGGMVEVPAAALALPAFVKRLKFLSIGTNDLIQYTLAIDRADSSVAHLYDHLHPAVLRLIAGTLRAGARARVPVAVCGELAGELSMTEVLLGMGLRQFSMHPAQIPAVKARVMECSAAEARRLAGRILRLWDADEVRRVVEAAQLRTPSAVA